ncbi:hypothetical protein D1BOALGB6SA_9756 [Olavius sp. associated proteobacterium Delta 1]|nr:hypothetical protein D1BOALGB6SA_9756 [Olavius sp. associated proteobacterium Delta 1]
MKELFQFCGPASHRIKQKKGIPPGAGIPFKAREMVVE